MRTSASLAIAIFALLACRTAPAPPEASRFVPPDAATGLEDPRLADLVRRYWSWQLWARPVFATTLGVRVYDDRIEDNSELGIADYRRRLASFVDELRGLDPRSLESARDRTSHELLLEDLEAELDGAVCQFERWSLSPRGNPVTEWSYLPELHPLANAEALERYLGRVSQIGASIRNEAGHLQRGARDGSFPNRESTLRVIEITRKQLDAPASAWPLVANLRADDRVGALRDEAARRTRALVESEVRPALAHYLEVLEQHVLPGARTKNEGLGALPFGGACYAAQIRRHTSLTLSPERIHEVGLAEIARIDAEIVELGQRLFGVSTLEEVLARLRSDPALYFDTEEAVEAKARAALAEAKAAMPRFFHTVPKADCVVTRIPDYEAPYTTIAYYRPPIPGEKPGEYFINVHAPTTRPRYEAAALAYHESIPGHHLQIAIAQELPALPAFRRHLGLNVFVEGWALYTERLADEMSLYATDLDRMGMLSYDAWRAARLVVDTGVHAFGWTREQAKAFMLEHTALAPNNIDNEVDRYIVWPGQALGYKLGQLEIWRLRREAEVALGERFSLPLFHDAVLTEGAVSMKRLRAQVEAFISQRLASKGP